MKKRITVFGSSSPVPGDQEYQQAYDLGKLLGKNNYIVITGGYIGTMEAVSRGAVDSGAHTIGITCDEIEAWRSVKHNKWVKEEMRYPTLVARIKALIEECDAAIALPGGPGTLAEITLMWNHLLIQAIDPKPLLLIGDSWSSIFRELTTSLAPYVTNEQIQKLTFVSNIDQAVQKLENLI